ncbi:peptidase C60 [Kitasatospora sp. MMS16-BH015]|uniref:class F sortase n=1 Tax=Kitasatospora sp. MMS16-BH015 TaxID=2018025 RepID=UPI000CA2A95C|nr:class F sortase [Kitasatospora sp. MMS16-BH015]AUG77491.1 peptidase C60 [Kitasatospora sp. MMS16-BH015]
MREGRSLWPGTIAAGLALVAGAWLLQGGTLPPLPGAEQALGAVGSEVYAPPRPRAVPTRVRIPRLGVDAPVTTLGLDREGRLEAPADTDRNLAGWYREGVTPGQRGTAVLAGHVDTREGPAVFYGLGSLRRGDQLEVAGADRGASWFVVDAVEVYPKKDFPDEKVYGPGRGSQLRLITCGGSYREGEGYDGNVVVFAHLVRGVSA